MYIYIYIYMYIYIYNNKYRMSIRAPRPHRPPQALHGPSDPQVPPPGHHATHASSPPGPPKPSCAPCASCPPCPKPPMLTLHVPLPPMASRPPGSRPQGPRVIKICRPLQVNRNREINKPTPHEATK